MRGIFVMGLVPGESSRSFDHLDGILYVDRIRDRSLFSFEEEYLQYHA